MCRTTNPLLATLFGGVYRIPHDVQALANNLRDSIVALNGEESSSDDDDDDDDDDELSSSISPSSSPALSSSSSFSRAELGGADSCAGVSLGNASTGHVNATAADRLLNCAA
jgi:hypothetical protein